MPNLDLLYLQESAANTVVAAVHAWCAATGVELTSAKGKQAVVAAVRLAKSDIAGDLFTALSQEMFDAGGAPAIGAILVVEDEPLIAMDIEESLKSAGFPVKICLSCSDAIAWLADHTPSAAILDIHLKDGPCHDVTRQLETQAVPFLVSSGSARADAEEIFLRGTWVAKPCDPDLMIEAVKRTVSRFSNDDLMEVSA